MPCVFDYTDYRAFLSDFYRDHKKRASHFSIRYMASKVGVDPAHVARILYGKRHVSAENIVRFMDLCGLNTRERTYFEQMVRFNKARTDRDRKAAFERLLGVANVDSTVVHPNAYQFYSRWYYTAIRSLVAIDSFRLDDAASIASTLRPKITVPQAAKALRLLLKLGFIAEREDGVLRVTEQNISTGPTWRSVAIQNYQEEVLELSRNALSIPRDIRDVSTVTVGVGFSDLPRLREMIAEFRSSLIRYATLNQCPDEVYQLNIQLFPVTRRSGGKKR